ncbi:hypothetical protein JHK85_025884 [Glycine max]|nr:hypothetical protein JHK85_025884 [Glycine max]
MQNRWGCPPSKFPWTYESKETSYLLEGKVKVTPSGATESVEIAAGKTTEYTILLRIKLENSRSTARTFWKKIKSPKYK